MAGIIFNPIQDQTDAPKHLLVSLDESRGDLFYRKLSRDGFLAFGISHQADFWYALADYTPPDPDPGGGSSRPSVGQLTP